MVEASEGPVRPLRGVRVLEIGQRLGVASAGLALTAMGADVVQVLPPDRDVPRPEQAYYDRGRRVLEWTTPSDLGELPTMADVIVTDLDDARMAEAGVPLDTSTLRTGADAQVLVTVRSLGRSGMNCDLAMTDITEWASSGLATVTRRPRPPDGDAYAPVLPPGQQPQALAGLAAATAAVVGRRWARHRHQPVVADVSVQEVVAALLHGIFPNYVWNGVVTGHPSTASTALGMLLPAADGDVYIRTLDPRQWDALMAWIDDPTIQALGPDPDSRLANNDALCMLIGDWTAKQRRMEILAEGQRRRIPVAVPRSLDDVLTWQHLRARRAWTAVSVDGADAEVPRLPLLEPTSWHTSTRVGTRHAEAGWGRSG